MNKSVDKKKPEPSIIFIDEIDSITPSAEKAQNENQRRLIATLLCCMDSIRENSQIVCIAATETADQLDSGIIRFGRFDRQIEIGNLDDEGRLEIYKIHTRNMTLADDIDLSSINKENPDLSGSQIAALCSEAAL